MRISIFGLGYVGAVSAACLAERGHVVTGVDPNTDKVQLINSGCAPVVEAELAQLTHRAVAEKRLSATGDPVSAVLDSEVTFVCVPTPSQANGNLDFRFIERVCTEIGAALREKRDFHVVVVRSTILPGTLRQLVIPTLESSSGRRVGEDFGVCHNPEFLRESTAVADFRNPPKTVIGASDSRSGDILQSIYEGLPGPVIRCPIEVGEMVKYADNTWHATKVTFANEIGNICKRLGVDSHAVMEIFCKDAKLNLSPYYLKPGFAFGGSCLPKDLRAITYHARSHDVSTPLLNSLMFSNQRADRAGHRHGAGRPPQEGGPARLQLQGGHRRSAREPAGGGDRATARQGLRPQALRPQRQPGEAHGRQPRIHHEEHPAHRAAHGRICRGSARSRGRHRDRQQRRGVRRPGRTDCAPISS